MDSKLVRIINKSPNPLPTYKHEGDSGMDICAWFNGEFMTENYVYLDTNDAGEQRLAFNITSGNRKLIHTGIYVSLPIGYEFQVRARSGLAIKNGITVLNGIGSIDSNYRGEICVILINHGHSTFVLHDEDRIAQLVLVPVSKCEWKLSEGLDNTDRGVDGFGSTGIAAENKSIQQSTHTV